MLKGFKFSLKAGAVIVGCVAVVGFAQAIELVPVSNVQANTSWQDIVGTSYTFNDANHNGQINVGEKVTFTVDMHKTNWGVHDFDALKFWIDSSGTNLLTKQFVWDFDKNVNNSNHSVFDYKPWTAGDKYFSFDYTFANAGTFDLTGSVMCSADLAGLTGLPQNDALMKANWGAWTENTHANHKVYQGETEKYKLTVVQSPVPEPQTYGMMLVGLGMLGFTARRRKDFTA
jgi:hypothetical protein